MLLGALTQESSEVQSYPGSRNESQGHSEGALQGEVVVGAAETAARARGSEVSAAGNRGPSNGQPVSQDGVGGPLLKSMDVFSLGCVIAEVGMCLCGRRSMIITAADSEQWQSRTAHQSSPS